MRAHRLIFFFVSSRRRHTICLSDWSSDVCSSDLYRLAGVSPATRSWSGSRSSRRSSREIGRASCRKSVDLGGRRIIKKKKTNKKKKIRTNTKKKKKKKKKNKQTTKTI